ncbi:flagellar basal body rod protein FlgB [Maledivibacter halophilus]|uniref:Flagellar basal body rod protein FlgB n=1 Tax=Maledivibacter halophilus TaxID=36842 RepID=A0A1T5LEQ3_9FIRM|nr:flagellar basal body rod protein FlgB [Maledivibacter halophilus]SKC74473.1 flagellar basal-body rod protein FlgB [Maledivibacter halophilus]
MVNRLNSNIEIYQKSLNASWLKHDAISNNLANQNTPGYKRQDVKFESILKDYIDENHIKLKTTRNKHFSNNNLNSLQPEITRELGTSFRKDKNNVNIDVEMAELSKNYIKFNALTRQLSGYLSRIKMSIRGGK